MQNMYNMYNIPTCRKNIVKNKNTIKTPKNLAKMELFHSVNAP